MVKQILFRHTRQQIEFDKYIAPDESEYSFDNAYDRFIWGRTGDGMPSITYQTQRGPFQDGVTPLGFTLNPRIIQLVHRRNADCRSDYWDNRADILNLLRPNRQPTIVFQTGVLRKEIPDGSVRDLSVLIEQGPAFRGSSGERWDEWSIQEALRFIAHDPAYFDPTKNSQQMTFSTTAEDIVFSFDFPITFSSNALSENNTITYTGTWLSYPTIILNGPMQDPIIRNLTTGEKIELTTIIGVDRTVTINLEYGNKTIVDDLGTNLIGTLTTDSDLSTFHLEPAPLAIDGVNSLGVAAIQTDGNTEIILEWFTRFIGI